MYKLMKDEQEGLFSLIGEDITVMCATYFYTGKLIGINNECIKLEDVSIVFETGSFDDKEWKDAQKLPHKYWYIQKNMIESFGIMK